MSMRHGIFAILLVGCGEASDGGSGHDTTGGSDDSGDGGGASASTGDSASLDGSSGGPTDADAGSSSDGGDEIPPDAIWVDVTLASDCMDYAPESRTCGTGAARAFTSLAAAAEITTPGDTVVVREMTTNERLVVPHSGEPDAPITFRRFPGETVTIRLPEGPFVPGIEVTDQHDVVLDGIDVDDAMMWGQILRSTRITLVHGTYSHARDEGSRGGFRFVDSDHNRVIENRFEDGNDNLFFEHSDHNLVVGNTLHRARHTLLVIACSSFNVIRSNELDNPDQKGSETFDCEGTIESLYDDTPQIEAFDATTRNLWEDNRFVGTRASEVSSDYNAMQFAGQRGIVRRNVYWNNLGGAIGVQVYPDEAMFNYGNRIYHNSITGNACFGILTSSDEVSTYGDNVILNNIVFANASCTGDGAADILDGNPSANDMHSNLTDDPSFVDAARHDLRLDQSSAAIDAAAFLTTTTTAGEGTMLPVGDSGFFYDGYGIAGEVGDTIRLEGDASTAVVIAIDDEANTLQLDRSLAWTSGQGVALDHLGTAPDIGALESD